LTLLHCRDEAALLVQRHFLLRVLTRLFKESCCRFMQLLLVCDEAASLVQRRFLLLELTWLFVQCVLAG
jgi:hypothetical protein